MTGKKEDKKVEAPKVEKKGIEMDVQDPQVLRPKELPLVVKPKGGKWANEAQEKYAKIVNAYAYSNQDKWANDLLDVNGVVIPNSSKKAVLLDRLAKLETAPGLLITYVGAQDENKRLEFKNKLHQD